MGYPALSGLSSMAVQMGPGLERFVLHLSKDDVHGRRRVFTTALDGPCMSMRQPKQKRVLRPGNRIGQTILQQRFAALSHFDILRSLNTERELRKVPLRKSVFKIRLERVGFE